MTPAVAATQSTGLDKNIAVQISGSNLLQANDLHIFGVRFDDSPTARSTTLSWDARFALPGAWRLGPRLSVEQLNDPWKAASNGSTCRRCAATGPAADRYSS